MVHLFFGHQKTNPECQSGPPLERPRRCFRISERYMSQEHANPSTGVKSFPVSPRTNQESCRAAIRSTPRIAKGNPASRLVQVWCDHKRASRRRKEPTIFGCANYIATHRTGDIYRVAAGLPAEWRLPRPISRIESENCPARMKEHN
jgi:hypothetical protein